MTDIADFLVARIYEDEEIAKAATPGPWRHNPDKVNSVDGEESVFTGPAGLAAVTVASTGPADGGASMNDAEHIARHDPAAVIVDCEARNAIVLQYVRALRRGGSGGELYTVLQWLALRYKDHPDYQPHWEPYRGPIETFGRR